MFRKCCLCFWWSRSTFIVDLCFPQHRRKIEDKQTGWEKQSCGATAQKNESSKNPYQIQSLLSHLDGRFHLCPIARCLGAVPRHHSWAEVPHHTADKGWEGDLVTWGSPRPFSSLWTSCPPAWMWEWFLPRQAAFPTLFSTILKKMAYLFHLSLSISWALLGAFNGILIPALK